VTHLASFTPRSMECSGAGVSERLRE